MEDAPIHEEISFELNKNDDLASQFARLNTHLDSMDAWMMRYGEQLGVLGDRMSINRR